MPTSPPVCRRPAVLVLIAALVSGVVLSSAPALAQDPGGPTSTTEPVPPTTVVEPPVDSTTTTTAPPDPTDPGSIEEVPDEPVPVVPDTVPAREGGTPVSGVQAGRIIRQGLRVAQAEAQELETTYNSAKERVVALEASLDRLETGVTALAARERAAVRRVELARRQLEARAVSAVVRGSDDELAALVQTDDPNELAVAQTLLGSVLDADEAAVRAYLAAKDDVDVELVRKAERLVAARRDLEQARAQLVESRRATVAAKFNLAVFAAGSEIVIHGFVFPVADPHAFGDSFGAARMTGTTYAHAHQGTDILAPDGTPLLACERGIVTKVGSDVLGGTKLWVKGESGTYYYYAHLSGFADGITNGTVVDAGEVVGFVGTTGNARGGPAHLHFEIHPDGGPAVNPYPLLKVVDDLARAAKASTRG